ncbi:hypothetical protein VTO42DRAFT_1905 [Malbranchea cinnamomea]
MLGVAFLNTGKTSTPDEAVTTSAALGRSNLAYPASRMRNTEWPLPVRGFRNRDLCGERMILVLKLSINFDLGPIWALKHIGSCLFSDQDADCSSLDRLHIFSHDLPFFFLRTKPKVVSFDPRGVGTSCRLAYADWPLSFAGPQAPQIVRNDKDSPSRFPASPKVGFSLPN